MFTDVINKQAFEITCKTETTARRVQHDIETHTAIQFSNIMNDVFSAAGKGNNFLQIDKIEIDLGDIWVDELGNMETASRFRAMLQQIIEDIQKKRSNDRSSVVDSNRTVNLSAESGNELELIRVFLTTGDLPWWIDKSKSLSIDSLVKKLLHQQQEMFRKLLVENSDKPGLLSRLYTQVSPASFSEIAEIVPEFSEAVLKDKLMEESVQMKVNHLSTEYQKKLGKILKEHKRNSFESRRYLLIEQLVKLYDFLVENNVSAEGSALENLFIQFGITGLVKPGENIHFTNRRNIKQQVKNEVSLLTVFEVEIFIFILSTFFDAANNSIYPNVLSMEGRSVFSPEGNQSNILNNNAGNVNETFRINKDTNQLEENYFTAEKTTVEPQERMLIQPPELSTGPVESNNREPLKTEIPTIATSEKEVIKDDLNAVQSDGPVSDAPGETKMEDLLPLVSKTIRFILKKLARYDKALIQYLQGLSKHDLHQLKAVFTQKSIEGRETKKMINQLLEHPSFINYDIFKIFTTLVYAKALPAGAKNKPLPTGDKNKALPTVNKLRKPVKENLNEAAQRPVNKTLQKLIPADLFAVIRQLPGRDILVVRDVLMKRRFDNISEQSVFKKILVQLSQQDILLLKYLTELPPTELEKMEPIATQSNLQSGENAAIKNEQYYKQNEEQTIQIENAGLCLLVVYLPGFFRQLGYLENGQFKNKKFAVRAVYLLQYIVSGNSKRPEYLLHFNKMLCSIEPGEVIPNNIRLTRKERQEADHLLVSVIQNWKSLKNTSVKGFRESFLQRKGILSETPSAWVLRVEKKGFDILLDAIPWSFNLVKLAWMKKIIRVEW